MSQPASGAYLPRLEERIERMGYPGGDQLYMKLLYKASDHGNRTAIQRFRDLEPYQLKWIEQPLLPSDLAAHARLRAAVSTAIGTGEDEWSVENYQALIESGGVDVIQIDPGRAHGITGSWHVIKLIETANLKWSAHTWSSALNTAASAHLLANSTHGLCMDFKPHESPMQHELVADPWIQKDGYLDMRNAPGLGVTVCDEIVRKYLMK